MLKGLFNGLVFLLVNGYMMVSCWHLSNYLLKDHQSLSLRVVAASILSFAHATVVVLLLGVVFRYLNAWSVPLLSLLISLSLQVFTRTYRRPFLQPAGQALSEIFSTRDYFLYAIAGLFVLQLMVLLLKVIWLPPHIWDVFVYHLPPAVEWYQQGFIPPMLETSVNRINGAPLGMTVLAYWFFIFFRDDILVEMPMLLWAVTLVPVSIAVMRQSGASRAWSFKFAVLIFFLPIVLMQGITTKDQLGLNISLIAGLLFLAEFVKQRKFPTLLVAATAFGLMLGYKIVAPVYILIALLTFSAILLTRHRALFMAKQHRLMLLKTAIQSMTIMLAVSGYWYLRNLIVHDRLLGAYATTVNKAGERSFKDSGAVEAVLQEFDKLEYFDSTLAHFFPRIFDYQDFYGADLVSISGFGPQFAAFGLLALVMAIGAFFNARLRKQPIFLLSSVAIALFPTLNLISYDANSYRILSFFPMILIAFAGVQLYRSEWLEKKRVNTMTSSIIALCIMWSGLTLLPSHYTNQFRFKEFISLDHNSRTSANFTSWFVRPRPNFYRIMDAVPVAEPIAYVAYRTRYSRREERMDTWQYLYMDRHWQRKTYSLNLPVYFDCQENGDCTTKPALKTFLKQNQVSLLSSCKTNRCLNIKDDVLIEILPGLYYFLENG